MQSTPSKSKLLVTWILASAAAVSVAMLISSPVTLAVIGWVTDWAIDDIPPDDPNAAIAAGDAAEIIGFCCAPPLFLVMFCPVTALVQWGILRKQYRTGVAVFVSSFFVILIATSVAIPIVRRLWLIAALGAAWFGGFAGAGRLLALTATTGGISGAITGIIVMRKSRYAREEQNAGNAG
jgi:hypothetical protein